MKQHEAVIQALEKLGGIATLGQLNHEVFKIKDCIWTTKTPFASVRRIVQLNKDIYKIKPGLYALVKFRKQLEVRGIIEEVKQSDKSNASTEFNHSYYQGLLLEIGNLKGHATYIPPQDKNRLFLNEPLGNISSVKQIFEFSYAEIVGRAKTVDVIWFNERKMLASLFEVEHSTDIQNSLLKYNDLQDFHTSFYIVSAKERKGEFEHKMKYSAFKDIKDRVKFIDYHFVSELHTKLFAVNAVGSL